MNKDQIHHIVNNYFRKLKKQYKSIDPDFDIEAIHHFRVAYKKLRAFFRLASFQKEKTTGVPKKLKKIYRSLGAIRDAQLQQLRIKAASKQLPKLPMGYMMLLSEQIATGKRKFLQDFGKDILDESKKKALEDMPSRLNRKNIPKFIQMQRTEIAAIIASG